MRKLNLKLILTLLVTVPLMFLMSCSKDDDDGTEPTEDFRPVLGENFDVSVDGNDVTITTTITGNVWATVDGVVRQLEDQEVTFMLPNAGTYEGTVSSQGSGTTLTSEPFEIEILEDNLDYLNEGLWKALSGGANQTKTWRVDWNSEGEQVYFEHPVQFSGHDGAPYWSWDVLEEDLPVTVEGTEMTGFYNWQETPAAPANFGTITFNATNGTVTTTNVDGDEESGTFQFNEETMKLTLSGDVIPPIDTARLNEGQFKEEDLKNLRIYSLTDSAMQIGIKRSFEGFEEDGVTPKPSQWIVVYNFIVVGYDYPEKEAPEIVYTPDIITDFSEEDLVGTWVYNEVPFNWISWSEDNFGMFANAWCTLEDVLAGDWVPFGEDTETYFEEAYELVFHFNADGTCVLNGVENTWTLTDGVITLGTELGDPSEFSIDWFAIGGSELAIVEVHEECATGIWLAVSNAEPGKNESSTVNLVKQE